MTPNGGRNRGMVSHSLRAFSSSAAPSQLQECAMPEPLNAKYFDQPHWLVIARGFQTEDWFNDDQAVGTGGILNPSPIHLRTGNYYYRFASSTSSRDSQLGGGWWIDFENFSKIKQFAQGNHYSLKEAARLMLALPYAWTRVDRLVRALLVQPLKAYAGEGKAAKGPELSRDKGTQWIPTQHIKIVQLYIPGLFVRSSQPQDQLFSIAFQQPAEVTQLWEGESLKASRSA
jgi:hypothetical protein